MNCPNMERVQQSAHNLRADLRELHTWAIGANPCAEMIVMDIMDEFANLKHKLNRLEEAIKETDPV